MASDFIDFYIAYPGHPNFRESQLIEDDLVRVIVQKWEMIIFTNRGELLGEPGFGGNLQEYLHETRLSAETIENDLRGQIATYISELNTIGYTLKVTFYEDPERYQEYMEVYFQIAEYDVYAVIS
jgi:hypothetical protein